LASLNIAALVSEARSHPVHPFSHPESQVGWIVEIFHGGIAAVLPERV
jgi:hypothetical protein